MIAMGEGFSAAGSHSVPAYVLDTLPSKLIPKAPEELPLPWCCKLITRICKLILMAVEEPSLAAL